MGFSKIKWFLLLLFVSKVLSSPAPFPNSERVEKEDLRRRDKTTTTTTEEPTTEPPDDSDEKSKSEDDDDKSKSSSEEKKKDDSSDEKSKDDSSAEDGDDNENNSKSDVSQPDNKSDDTSEENEGSDSNSNPDTEEEGDSSSASNTSEDKKDDDSSDDKSKKSKSDSSSDESDESNTTENDKDESTVTSEETSEESDDSDKDSSDSSDESSDQSDETNKLLVIMLGGVSPDYISRDERKLKAFAKMKENGVKAKYVKPVFPSNSFPNWYSIATGKYPERHGIINDFMYDTKRKDLFLRADEKDKKWWGKAEPIWVTAKKQKKRVHVSWWTGCDILIKKHLPQYCDPYRDLTDDDKYAEIVSKRLMNIVDKFAKDEYDLAMVYYEGIIDTGRKNGPDSRKTKKALREVDDILDDLLEEMVKKEVADDINLVVLSDHGLTTSNRVIRLEKYLDFNDIEKVVGEGAFVMIQPERKKTDHVYGQLRQANVRGLNVYKKEKLPSRYHLKKSDLVLPIILTADEGFVIDSPEINNKIYPSGEPQDDEGHTGYDADHVEEMRAILYAVGPDFREDYEASPLKQVDHYNLFCKLLDIKCKENDGDEDRIESLLKKSEESEESSSESESDESDERNSGLSLTASGFVFYMLILMASFKLMSLK